MAGWHMETVSIGISRMLLLLLPSRYLLLREGWREGDRGEREGIHPLSLSLSLSLSQQPLLSFPICHITPYCNSAVAMQECTEAQPTHPIRVKLRGEGYGIFHTPTHHRSQAKCESLCLWLEIKYLSQVSPANNDGSIITSRLGEMLSMEWLWNEKASCPE